MHMFSSLMFDKCFYDPNFNSTKHKRSSFMKSLFLITVSLYSRSHIGYLNNHHGSPPTPPFFFLSKFWAISECPQTYKCEAVDMEIIFHSHGIKSRFHKKRLLLSLVL